MSIPKVPGRTTPGFVFSIMKRCLKDCLGRRRFGKDEVRSVLAFFGERVECVFCGSANVERWDHLVSVARGGETVIGNMVPACGVCDDSKAERDFEVWMCREGNNSLAARGVGDVEGRVEKIREYVRHFGYSARPLEERLDEPERAQLDVIRRKADSLRHDTERLIEAYRRRNGGR